MSHSARVAAAALLTLLGGVGPLGAAQEVPKRLPGPLSPSTPAVSQPPPASVDIAYGAYQRGLYLTAFREATARLERDPKDAAAMTLLGELFNQGLSVRQSPEQAADWFRLAAQMGEPHAMASLGLMSIDGRGVPKDPIGGRAWLEKAAAAGEPTACYNLALILLTSGEPDFPRAAALLRIAAAAEIGDAQHDLGVLVARGQGVPKDAVEAARLYARAAKNGSISGQVELAIAMFNGDGIARDEAIAARLFRRAAVQGNAIAQNRLARLYASGRGVPKNLVEAAAWHMAASAQGLGDDWLDTALRDIPQGDRAKAQDLAAERVGMP